MYFFIKNEGNKGRLSKESYHIQQLSMMFNLKTNCITYTYYITVQITTKHVYRKGAQLIL